MLLYNEAMKQTKWQGKKWVYSGLARDCEFSVNGNALRPKCDHCGKEYDLVQYARMREHFVTHHDGINKEKARLTG